MAGMLRITQIRSLCRRPEIQRRTLRALGLRKIGHLVEKKDTPQIRGMINQVKHMIAVEEV